MIALVLALALAVAPPAPTTPAPGPAVLKAESPKPLSEDARKDLIIAYQSAVIAQSEAQAAQARLNTNIAAYNDVVVKAVKDFGYPEGTQFNVNLTTKTVQPILPPAKTEAAPAEKK